MNAIGLIDGFEKLSKQELLDLSVKHLTTTKCPSINDTGMCVYSGSGCGAAPFIKPKYREQADRLQAWDNVITAPEFKSSHEKDFIAALQRCHDEAITAATNFAAGGKVFDPSCINVNKWKQEWSSRVRILARSHGLSIPSFLM